MCIMFASIMHVQHNRCICIHTCTSFALKVDMPILTCIFFTFNWLTLTSEMHFVKFHPKVASCLLSRGKRKYAPLGMRLLWKYVRNYFLVYQLISHFLSYLQNYKEFEAEILDLQLEIYGLSFDIKKCTTSGWALGDENVIRIRTVKSHTKASGIFLLPWMVVLHYTVQRRTSFVSQVLSPLAALCNFVNICVGTLTIPPRYKCNTTQGS